MYLYPLVSMNMMSDLHVWQLLNADVEPDTVWNILVHSHGLQQMLIGGFGRTYQLLQEHVGFHFPIYPGWPYRLITHVHALPFHANFIGLHSNVLQPPRCDSPPTSFARPRRALVLQRLVQNILPEQWLQPDSLLSPGCWISRHLSSVKLIKMCADCIHSAKKKILQNSSHSLHHIFII